MALLVCVLAIVMVLMAAVLAGVFLAIAYHNSALAYIILGAVFGFVFLAVLVMDVSFRWWPGKFDE
jgi:hypothetical protein